MQKSSVRTVKLFTNGRSQAVRIPREFELPGDEAVMRKEGNRLIIEPTQPRDLLAWLATLDPIEEGGTENRADQWDQESDARSRQRVHPRARPSACAR